MRAKDLSGHTPGGARTILADVVPLKTPFLLYIFPIYACNFKCKYCIFSVDKKKRGFISDKTSLDLKLYKKCIDELEKFPSKLKVIRFVGMGEPLLHKDIAEMVRYAKEKDRADTIEILTNASLLSHEMSDALIQAGLSRLIISIQGTSKRKYFEVSGIEIDFDKFVENINYFYDHKKNTHLYIKIVDTALEDEEDRKRFYQIFGNICDSLAVEHTVPIYPGVDYNQVLGDKELPFTQFGLPVSKVKICPQPFFTYQINPDGKVVPCFSLTYPEIVGDCNNESIYDIWNGKKFDQFRLKMLEGVDSVCETCSMCNIIKFRMSPEDMLEAADTKDRMKKYYEDSMKALKS
jgi:Predicted Fe-S oxidoreductases